MFHIDCTITPKKGVKKKSPRKKAPREWSGLGLGLV